MAAIAHLGVGLASKSFAKKVPLGILIVAAWFLDVIWGVFFFFKIENFPAVGVNTFAPWSHSPIMALFWSFIGFYAYWLFARDKSSSVLVGIIIFSHWVIDFITWPMTANFPNPPKMPLLFFGSHHEIGLGLYNTPFGTSIGEYGSLLLGIIIYTITFMKIKNQKKKTTNQDKIK